MILFNDFDIIQAENMVLTLNKIHKSIQFTLDTQINSKINFLDLIISIIQIKFDFGIYRKPIKTNSIIPINYNYSYKMNKNIHILILFCIDLSIFL